MTFFDNAFAPSTYGYVIAFSSLGAYCVARFLLTRLRISLEQAFSFDFVFFFTVVSGILGARLLFVLYNLPYFLDNPSEIPAIWHGGWVWHGGLIGGAFALFVYSRIKKISFLLLADIIVPCLALAQSIGRWGNYFNQELYGKPTDVSWALFIDPAHRVTGFESFAYFHPTFLYESLWSLFLFLTLFLLSIRFVLPRSNTIQPGLITALYLFFASLGRFGIEFIRIDQVPVFWGLRVPQWIALALIGVAIALLLQRRKKMV